MRCKKNKNSTLKTLLIISIIAAIVLSYFHFFVNPQIVSSNTANIKAYTISVINTATASTINSNDYDDLIEITKSADVCQRDCWQRSVPSSLSTQAIMAVSA